MKTSATDRVREAILEEKNPGIAGYQSSCGGTLLYYILSGQLTNKLRSTFSEFQAASNTNSAVHECTSLPRRRTLHAWISWPTAQQQQKQLGGGHVTAAGPTFPNLHRERI
jgi:hypothetical protein